MLAGISAEYYLRLERGRDRHPSLQVLESIARVLQLDEEHLAHLVSLVSDAPRKPRRKPRLQTLPAGIRALLPTLPYPAFVEGRYFDILAANELAPSLSPRLVAGKNQLLDLFLDPAEQALHLDLDGTLRCYVSSLRQAVGPDSDDQRLIELVGELSVASPRFRELWSRHDVKSQQGALVRFDHPRVGELALYRERLSIAGADDLALMLYHADPGSENAEKLALLASMTLGPAEPLSLLTTTDPSPEIAER
jgi:transcriptional regulator with XRE-family HTH domain